METIGAVKGFPLASRLDYLDGWRGLAIGFVLISHFFPVKGFNLGRLGVDVFFVLSGLLMSNILYVKRIPLKTFYKRRISRVFPVFFVFLSLVCLSSWVWELSAEHSNYLYSLVFLRAYFPTSPDLWNTGLPIGHIWSLNVEEHCYLLLGALTLVPLFRQREYLPLLALGFASMSLNGVYAYYPDLASANAHLKTEIVAVHLLLSAGYCLLRHHLAPFVPSWLPLLTFGVAMLCYVETAPPYAMWLLSPLLLAFTVNHLDSIPAILKTWLSSQPLRLLGVWSYSVYLWQQLFFFYRPQVLDGMLGGVLMLIGSIALGVFSFYVLESPVREYLNKRW